MSQRSHKIIVVLFSLMPFSSPEAQNIFRQPNNIQKLTGRQQNEHRAWMYQFSPQYEKKATFHTGSPSIDFYRRNVHEKAYPNFFKKYSKPAPSTRIQCTLLLHPLIRPEFYTHQLGYFCKKEIQLDKISPIPIRFRLGSKEYVDYLENKPNSSRTLQ